MKHISHIISALICLMAATTVSAQQISESDAKEIAQSFLAGQPHRGTKASTGKQLSLVYTQPSPADAATANLYVFSNPQGGFAIVAADERVGQTILGYSDHGTFSPDNMPDNVRFWLSDYARQIDFVKAHAKVKKEKNIKTLDGNLPTGYTTQVGPLIKTKWGQDAPYNAQTPTYINSNNEEEHSRTGCVATAMAQVMAYHKYPAVGKGSHVDWWSVQVGDIRYESVNYGEATYNWDGMTEDDIAKLMYHCGIAVDMEYDIKERGGSGATDNKIGAALKTYFGYSKSVSYVEKKNYGTEASWTNLMMTELDNSRPVIYGAWDSHHDFGHELILDGYAKKSDTDVMFHINWGWDGACDGYYAISALNPDNAYTNNDNVNDFYDSNHVATIKIQPNNDPDVKEWLDESEQEDWPDWSDFGTGMWYDTFTTDLTTGEGKQYALEIRTNKTYPYMKQIKVVAWNKPNGTPLDVSGGNYNGTTYHNEAETETPIDLIFNWNTALNKCFMPNEQYMGIYREKQEKTGTIRSDIYYRNAVIGSYGTGTDNGLYNVATQTFTIDYVVGYWVASQNKYDLGSGYNKTTATLKIGGAFSLKDFTESNDHTTATQEANIYDCRYFRTKLVPVEEILGKEKIQIPDNLISYYKTLSDVILVKDIEDYLDATDFSLWISETNKTDVKKDEVDGDYDVTYYVPAEGAYYAIVVFTDETGTIKLGFDYMPVYFSSSDRWEKLGHGTLIDNIYWVQYGQLKNNGHPLDKYYAPYKVEVEEYLDETANTKLYRLKNPFYYDEDEDDDNAKAYFSPAWKDFAEKYHDEDYEGCYDYSYVRKDVYLYFYKDQDGDVSLYPNVFERQPLGYDWSYGEVMLSAVKHPAYTCTTLTGDKNATETIQFPAALLTSYENDISYNVGQTNTFDSNFTETPERMFTLKLHNRELNDATAYSDSYTTEEQTAEENYVNRVTYTRDGLSDWGTLVLPFNYTAPDGFTFYKLTGYSDSNLTFDAVTEATANTPIVFKRNASTTGQLKVYATNIYLSDAATLPAASTTDGTWSEIGTYSPVAITTAANATSDASEYTGYTPVTEIKSKAIDLTKAYIFDADKASNGQATQATAGIRVPSYRAFFYNNGNASAPKVVRMLFNDGTSTSIETTYDDGIVNHSRINTVRYNLTGQPVTKAFKGIVIENGKKVLR
ncbi:MAG: C10 family peptidase [Prevotellaceae bacterium]|nr:C10 family peptidase [Candidatus Colivivens caballi]